MNRPTSTPVLPGARTAAFAAWFTLLYALAIGFRNGGGDQPAYLPLALRLADPTVLPGDWFTWETPHSHYVFGVVAAGMAKMGALELGLMAGALLQSTAFALFLLLALTKAYERPLLPWAATLLLAAANGLIHPAGPMLIPKEFSATGIAGASTVAMLALLLTDRPRWAGLAAGVAGLFHALYAVLLGPVVGVVAATLWARGKRGDGAVLAASYGVLAAPTVIRALRFGSTPGVEEAQEIAREVFAVHLVPSSWNLSVYLPFVGALMLGGAGLLIVGPRVTKEFRAAVATVAMMVFVSLPLGYLDVGGISTVWPWRLGPLLTLIGLAAVSAALCRPDRYRFGDSRAGVLALGLLVVGATVYGRQLDRMALLTVAVAASLPLILVPRPGSVSGQGATPGPGAPGPSGGSVTLAVLVLTVGFLPLTARGIGDSNYRIGVNEDIQPVVDWIRTSTAPESVFATPPAMGDFRLAAMRPTVGDMVATPWYPPARIAWRQRIRDLSGVQSLSDWAALDRGFLTMDCERGLRLRRQYGVDYVLLREDHGLDCGRVAYVDRDYAVVDLRGAGGAP